MILYGGTPAQITQQKTCDHDWHGPCLDTVSRYYKCIKCFCLDRDIREEKTNMVFAEIVTIEMLEKIAEYLALASQLELTSSKEEYRRANQLSLELAMWLPADVYRHLVWAIAEPSEQCNPMTAVVAVRAWLRCQETRGVLTPNELAGHFPGAGKIKQ